MFTTIIDHLIAHARHQPDRIAYIICGDDPGKDRKVSYSQLVERVNASAYSIRQRDLHGRRALLLFEDVLDFIVAFLVCQWLGIIAVPVPSAKGKKQIARLHNIISDAGADLVFCAQSAVPQLREMLSILVSDPGGDGIIGLASSPRPDAPFVPSYTPNSVSFIQYTSGSTGKPKGVVITAGNLLHNEQLIRDCFHCDTDSTIFCWLPYHHDMGLIGNILHTLYIGCCCVIMPAQEFIQNPAKWLQGISAYRATHSGAPNFAYDLCAERITDDQLRGLDLSCWQVAYNGSEPVRAETLERFAGRFSAAGFSRSAFHPCYGLAEATLLVSGRKEREEPFAIRIARKADHSIRLLGEREAHPDAKRLVSSGQAPQGIEVKIISPHSGGICGDLEEGEICIRGESVTPGYWNSDDPAIFSELPGGRYFNTGDLGFLYKNELFVSGRSKEMLIIRGQNFYPADIGETVAGSHPAIETNGVAVFEWRHSEEEWVVVAEIKRVMLDNLDTDEVIDRIDSEIQGTYGFKPFDILLTSPYSIPRTTSGKLQRLQCRELYAQKNFRILGAKRSPERLSALQSKDGRLTGVVLASPDADNVKRYVVNLITSKIENLSCDWTKEEMELTAIGIDSIRAMELMNTINKDLDLNIDAARLFQHSTLRELILLLENMLWLKTAQPSGKEITI